MKTEQTFVTAFRRHLKLYTILFAVGLLVGGILPGVAGAGTLEPPAAAVDGSGDPASTGATYPAWDKILPANDGVDSCHSSRFTCVMPATLGGTDFQAVRDNETGLVWEKSPDSDDDPGDRKTWISAIFHCSNRTVGGRKGWHLPMREQLASLVDPSNSNPALPTSHPFSNVQSSFYWSATTNAGSPARAWSVVFNDGGLGTGSKSSTTFVWCVRGGQSFDGNTHSTLH